MKKFILLTSLLSLIAQADVLINGLSPEEAYKPFISKNFDVSAEGELIKPSMNVFAPILHPVRLLKDAKNATFTEVKLLLINNNTFVLLVSKHAHVKFNKVEGGLGESAEYDAKDTTQQVFKGNWKIKGPALELNGLGSLTYLAYNGNPSVALHLENSTSDLLQEISKENILLYPIKKYSWQ